jgi:ribosomal protein L1
MSAKICKCCGGNGWEGSNCEAKRRENERLWRDYEFGQTRINNQRMEIVALSKDVDRHYENYADQLKRAEAFQRRIDQLEIAVTKIRDCDFVITLPDRMDAVRAIAREALEL